MNTTTKTFLLALATLAGCGTAEGVGEVEAALTTRTVISDPGRLVAVEGSDCFFPFAGGGVPVTKSGAWVAPTWVNDATIIFNGFNAGITSTDHHLRLLEAKIGQVAFGADRVLRWTFSGAFQDDNPYGSEVCYHFTVLGWDRADVAARSHVDNAGVDTDYDGFSSASIGYGVQTRTVQPPDCPFASDETVAVLPRGSSHGYTGGDHHVLQVGSFVSQDTNPGACTIWTTKAVLKDNNADDQTRTQVVATLLGGRGVRVQGGSDFTLTNRSGSGGCVTAPGGETSEHVRVTGLTFDYAVPLLTGWELYYPCDDEHVASVGASVRNLRYDRVTGTLEYDYVSLLADQNAQPSHRSRRRVPILGLERTELVNAPIGTVTGVLAQP
jgi:hypothetical protein